MILFKPLRAPEYYHPDQVEIFHLRNKLVQYIAHHGKYKPQAWLYKELGLTESQRKAEEICKKHGYEDLEAYVRKIVKVVFSSVKNEVHMDKYLYNHLAAYGFIDQIDGRIFPIGYKRINKYYENLYGYMVGNRVKVIMRKEFNACLRKLYEEYGEDT